MDKRLRGKPIDWIGSSLDDLKSFPDEVQQAFGFGLYQVQMGDMPTSAKPLEGNLSGVYELKDKIYVLHFFQKKSKSGIATSQKNVDLMEKRLKLAREDSKGEKK